MQVTLYAILGDVQYSLAEGMSTITTDSKAVYEATASIDEERLAGCLNEKDFREWLRTYLQPAHVALDCGLQEWLSKTELGRLASLVESAEQTVDRPTDQREG